MVFDRNEKKQVVALLGAGSMGTAIVRRIAAGKKILPEHIVALDMVGTGYAVDAFGEVMAEGGAGLIISSQAAYMYPIPNEIEL